ncbi:MAG: TolC family protein [Halanaerobiales bacterium]|nr:TolC family protein [Halanaerobiales bacterium]
MKSKRGLMLVITCILVVLLNVNLYASSFTLEEAINWGKAHNFELVNLNNKIQVINKEMELLKANTDFLLDFGLELTRQEFTVETLGNETKEEMDYLQIGLSGSKVFNLLGGTSIKYELLVNERDPFEFEDIKDKTQLKVELSQVLYPIVPIEPVREIKKLKNDLEKAKLEYEYQVGSKEIDWLSKYLELNYVKEKLKIMDENYTLAEKLYTQSQLQLEVGEGGKSQALMAEVELKQAQLQLQQGLDTFDSLKESWYKDLNFLSGQDVALCEEDETIESLRIKSNSVYEEVIKGDVNLLLADNTLLKINLLNTVLTEEQRNWQKSEEKIQIESFGNYETLDEDWIIGLNLKYNILDGGAKKVSVQEYDLQLDLLELEKSMTLDNLKYDLNELIKQIEAQLLNVKIKELDVNRADLENATWNEQFQFGLFTENDYQKKLLETKEKELDLQNELNKLMIIQARFLHFLTGESLF